MHPIIGILLFMVALFPICMLGANGVYRGIFGEKINNAMLFSVNLTVFIVCILCVYFLKH